MPLMPKTETMQREADVWDLRRKGMTYESISKQLDIPYDSVCTILKRLHKKYKEKNLESIEQTKLEHVVRLEHIFEEATKAWLECIDDKGIKGASYLKVATAALEDIRKIVGANSPIKTENTGSVNIGVVGMEAESVLKRIEQKINKGLEDTGRGREFPDIHNKHSNNSD